MTHIPVWWFVLTTINIACSLAVVVLLCLILKRPRGSAAESGDARQAVTLDAGVDWGTAPPMGETVQTAPCPLADTCDRKTCRMETMLAAEGGFGDPVCAKCGAPARMIESKLVVMPEEWRDVVRFADAITCDSCGYTTEGEVPFISLDPALRRDPARLNAAMAAAARELITRVRECDTLDRLNNPGKGAE